MIILSLFNSPENKRCSTGEFGVISATVLEKSIGSLPMIVSTDRDCGRARISP